MKGKLHNCITKLHYHHTLTTCLNSCSCSFREPKAAAHSLEKLLCETKPSRQTGWIIGSILMKTNPYNPTLRSLVEWPLWPPILKAYSKLWNSSSYVCLSFYSC